jgi:hypothetical protein
VILLFQYQYRLLQLKALPKSHYNILTQESNNFICNIQHSYFLNTVIFEYRKNAFEALLANWLMTTDKHRNTPKRKTPYYHHLSTNALNSPLYDIPCMFWVRFNPNNPVVILLSR